MKNMGFLIWILLVILITNDAESTLSPTVEPSIEPTKSPTPSPTTLPTKIIDLWIKNDTNIPQRYFTFGGYDEINDRIFLIGGVKVNIKWEFQASDEIIPIISIDANNGSITNYSSLTDSDTTMMSNQHRDWYGSRENSGQFPLFYSITQGYAVLDNVIYMLLTGSGLIYSFNMTDLKTTLHDENEGMWLGDLGINGTGFAMASICSDNKRFIAVIGGVIIKHEEPFHSFLLDSASDTRNRAVIYDFIFDEWIILKNLKKPRIGHACWIYNNKYIYVFGGSTSVPTITDTWLDTSTAFNAQTTVKEINDTEINIGDKSIEKLIYNDSITNIDLQEWNIIPNEMCIGRRGHRVTQILNDNHIYIIGGHYGGRVVEVLLPDENDLIIPSSVFDENQRIRHTVVSSNDKIFIIGLLLIMYLHLIYFIKI